MENKQSRKTLAERIENSGEHLNAEDREIVENMILLYQLSDKKGMRSLPMALVIRGIHNKIYRIGEGTEKATRRMDDLARIADNYMKSKDYNEAFLKSFSTEDNIVGPVREFYRESLKANGTQ